MNWRTDKPTADVIVAYSRYVFGQIVEYGFDVLNKFNGEYYHDGELVPFDNIIKWADLEEDEIVMDCTDHTFTHHETDESLQEAVTHQMEDEQVVDDYVRRGLDDIALKYAQLGAKWQKEQLRDLCYQCEKNGETIYYNGMKHAVEQTKKEALELTVCLDDDGYPCIPEIVLFDFDKNQPTAKEGDKIKVYIFRNNKE